MHSIECLGLSVITLQRRGTTHLKLLCSTNTSHFSKLCLKILWSLHIQQSQVPLYWGGFYSDEISVRCGSLKEKKKKVISFGHNSVCVTSAVVWPFTAEIWEPILLIATCSLNCSVIRQSQHLLMAAVNAGSIIQPYYLSLFLG